MAERYAVFDFTPTQQALQGYVWDFPARVAGDPHHNRGLFDARISPQRERAALPTLLAGGLRKMGSDPETAQVQGHPIHWFHPHNTFAQPRLLLVGDALGAEPLFGEGIGPALAYGRIAAETLAEAFARGQFTFQDYRPRVLMSSLGGYLLLRWWVARWTYRFSGNDAFMHLMWIAGKGLAALRNNMMRALSPPA